MFKVCIIGCGMIANSAHIPAYKKYSEDFNVVAVCDNFEENAKKTADSMGIEFWYTDAEKMLEEQKPDVVSVCAPNMFHKKYVMLALSYGANVLCEKPLELSFKEAKEMFDYAKKQDKVLMACQSLRFLPERLKAKELVDNGEVGDIYYAQMSRIRRRGIPTWGKFHIKSYSGGGALVDIGVHGIDSAIWLMGNPEPYSVRAVMNKVHAEELGSDKSSGALKGNVDTSSFNPEEMDVESFASGIVKFCNGASLDFRVSWAANLRDENNITLSGNGCGIDIESRKIYKNELDISDMVVIPNGFSKEPFFGHFCIVENLAKVLKGEAEPFIKPEETLNTTAIIEAAYLSVEENREILIEEVML